MTQREEIDELRARVVELEGEKRAAIELWDHLFRACDEWPGGCGPGKKQWKEFVATYQPGQEGYRDIVLAIHIRVSGSYSITDTFPHVHDTLNRYGWTSKILDMAPLDLVNMPKTDTSGEAILGRYVARLDRPETVAAFEASEKRRTGVGWEAARRG